MKLLDNIKIVLVDTSHPGNIGSAARACETMGVNNLVLVNPVQFPHPKAYEMAAGAKKVIQNIVITGSLEEAINDCHIVIATSARDRAMSLPTMNFKECGTLCAEYVQRGGIAILFGPEDSGLSNEMVLKSNFQAYIPTSNKYGVLNLASAVQVMCYELRMAMNNCEKDKKEKKQLATHKEVEGFYQSLEKILVKLEYHDPQKPRKLMPRLRRLFNRAILDQMEINILRGIITAMEKNIKGNKIK